jgi:ATP-dependent RNA helicase RhlE
LLNDMPNDRALVFTRTKHTANRVAGHLVKAGIAADAIHGNKSQSARERALSSFKQGELRALVATDIAARGIDIDGLACVINYDLPNEPEAYVHRIGRTGRAGSSGRALSFCEAVERPQLRSIERLTRASISVVEAHPFAPQGGGVETHRSPVVVAQNDRRHISVQRLPTQGPAHQVAADSGDQQRRRRPRRRRRLPDGLAPVSAADGAIASRNPDRGRSRS